MKRFEVIVRKWMRNKNTGATASIYGAHPASGAIGDRYDDWEIVDGGFTIRDNQRNTVGAYCLPANATKEQCEQFIERAGQKEI